MAQNNFQIPDTMDLLGQLIKKSVEFIPRGVGATSGALGAASAGGSPMDMLANIMNSSKQGYQNPMQAGQAMQAQSNPHQGQLDQVQLDALHAQRKNAAKAHAEEAYATLGDAGAKKLLDHNGYYDETATKVAPQQSQANPLELLSKLLGNSGGNVVNGTYQPRQFLGGLVGESAKNQLMRQQAIMGGQQTQNLSPLQAGEDPWARLNPEQTVTAQGSIYANNVKAAQDSLTDFHNQMADLNSQADAAVKQATAAQATTGIGGKWAGSGDIRKNLQEQMVSINRKRMELTKQANQASMKLTDILGNPPQRQESGNSFSGETSTGVKFKVSG